MKLLSMIGFEMPGAFKKMGATAPPQVHSDDHRNAADAIARPHFGVIDPAALHFPDKMLPTVPGKGGYESMGLGMVTYDHQPKWDRLATDQAGPVKSFFRRVMFDNRMKHV